jgi:hypothetical protein
MIRSSHQPARLYQTPFLWRVAFPALCIIGASVPATSQGKINIEGTLTAVRVTTAQDTVSDVLAAFCATLNVRYRTLVPLNRVISGTYTGTAAQVIKRLLEEQDYVMRNDDEMIELTVYGGGLGGPDTLDTRPGPALTSSAEAGARLSRPAPKVAFPIDISTTLALFPDSSEAAAASSGVIEQAPAQPVGPGGVATFSRAQSAAPRFKSDPAPASNCSPDPAPRPAVSDDPASVAAAEPDPAPVPAPAPRLEATVTIAPDRARQPISPGLGPMTVFSRMFPDASSYSRARRAGQARETLALQRQEKRPLDVASGARTEPEGAVFLDPRLQPSEKSRRSGR